MFRRNSWYHQARITEFRYSPLCSGVGISSAHLAPSHRSGLGRDSDRPSVPPGTVKGSIDPSSVLVPRTWTSEGRGGVEERRGTRKSARYSAPHPPSPLRDPGRYTLFMCGREIQKNWQGRGAPQRNHQTAAQSRLCQADGIPPRPGIPEHSEGLPAEGLV